MSTLLGSEELEEKVRHIQKKLQEAQLRVSTKNKTRSMSAVSNNEGPGKGTRSEPCELHFELLMRRFSSIGLCLSAIVKCDY